jgi:hypothetical protein
MPEPSVTSQGDTSAAPAGRTPRRTRRPAWADRSLSFKVAYMFGVAVVIVMHAELLLGGPLSRAGRQWWLGTNSAAGDSSGSGMVAPAAAAGGLAAIG